jgi:hypothetical protein
MDKQRYLVIEALEISNEYVKRQKDGIAVLMLRTLTKTGQMD